MNAPLFLPTKKQQMDRAMMWRGHFIQAFGEAELIVGLCLKLLSQSTHSASAVRLGLQIRPAVDEMKRLIRPAGPYATMAKSLMPSIAVLDEFLDWRPGLTHGVFDVWLGGKSGWFIDARYCDGDNSGPIRIWTLPFSEAQELLDEFVREVGILEQRFDALARRADK